MIKHFLKPLFLTGLLCSSVYAATDSELRDKNTQLQAQTQELTRQVIKATADNKAAIDQRFDAAINNLDISLTTLDGELANIEAGVTGVAAATTATSNITTQNLIKIAKESLAANGTTGLNYDMLSNSSGLTQTLIGNATPWTTGLFDIGKQQNGVTIANTQDIAPALEGMIVLVKAYAATGDSFHNYANKLKVLPGNYELVTTRNGYFFNVFQIKPVYDATAKTFDWNPDNNPEELYNGYPKRFTIAATAYKMFTANTNTSTTPPTTTPFTIPIDSLMSKDAFAATLDVDSLPAIPAKTVDDKNIKYASFENAKDLRLSASGFFSKDAFQKALNEILAAYPGLTADKVVVVDLRKELHGFVEFDQPNTFPDGKTAIAKGMPIVQASKDNSRAEPWNKAKMKEQEKAWLDSLNGTTITPMLYTYALWDKNERTNMKWEAKDEAPWEVADKKNPTDHNNEAGTRYYFTGNATFQSEGDMVRALGAQYIQIPVTDHDAPNPADIDDLVKLYTGASSAATGIPNDATNVFHLHCSAGKGRTSMAFIVYTILKKGDTLSLKELIQQIQDLRDYNLLALVDKKTGAVTQKTNGFTKRLNTIRQFYIYRNDSGIGYGTGTSFANWLKTFDNRDPKTGLRTGTPPTQDNAPEYSDADTHQALRTWLTDKITKNEIIPTNTNPA